MDIISELNEITSEYEVTRNKNILWFRIKPLVEVLSLMMINNYCGSRKINKTRDDKRAIANEISDYIIKQYTSRDGFIIKNYGGYIKFRIIYAMSYEHCDVCCIHNIDYPIMIGKPKIKFDRKINKGSKKADQYTTPTARKEIVEEIRRRENALLQLHRMP